MPLPNIEGLKPVDPKLLEEYERQMDEAVPKIIRDVARREALAEEGRRRIYIPPQED